MGRRARPGRSLEEDEGGPVRIVVTGPPLQMNLGGPSIFHGVVRVLQHVFPGCEITYHEDVPSAAVVQEGVPDWPEVRVIRGRANAKRVLRAVLRPGAGKEGGATAGGFEEFAVAAIRAANLYVDAWGIDFADTLSRTGWKSVLAAKPLIRAAHRYGVPAVHYTSSYGPVNGFWTCMTVRAVLGRRCAMVYCRESASRDVVERCGVMGGKLVVAPDTGFLMPARHVGIEGRDPERPCLGVSVSFQVKRQWKAREPYLDALAAFCDRAVRSWGVQVLLLPNELSEVKYDDRAVARDLLDRCVESDSLLLFPSERHGAQDLKGAIGQCEMLVGSRYHSVVAAMALGIPSVVVGWHHKYDELLAHFGQAGMGLSSEDCTADALWARASDVWSRRRETADAIRAHVPDVQRRIYQAGERLRDVVDADAAK